MEKLVFPVTKREAERQNIPYSSETNKNALFPSRLRKLREEKGVSQGSLAKVLGVSKSTVGLWETGDTLPDAKAIFDLSVYYNVSTDYLLRKTDIQTSDMKAKEICEYTGLTADTVLMLSVYATQGKIISSFLTRFFEDLVVIHGKTLHKINTFLVNAAHANAIAELSDQTESDIPEIDNIIDSMNGTHNGQFRISAEDAAWYFLSQAQSLAKGSIDIILEYMEEELRETYTSEGVVSPTPTPEKRIWKLIEDE